MIVAEDKKKDAFLIRTCERVIELDMINFLTNLRDINAKQTICLIPCDEDGNLLLLQPITWNDLKDGKFLIINGQHNISASKSLQETSVCAARREELQTWNEYIVYYLHKNKIKMILEWYNSCNHLKHLQPTFLVLKTYGKCMIGQHHNILKTLEIVEIEVCITLQSLTYLHLLALK
jgi:hypothetical protein